MSLRNTRAFVQNAPIMACAVLVSMTGCLFDSKLPQTTQAMDRSQVVDTIYPANAVPARIVELYQPLLDPNLGRGKSSNPETFPPVNVKEDSGQIVRYHLTKQRFGSWSSTLEFKWNYFLLQSNFLFPNGLPDTVGMAEKTKTLYDSIHHEDLFTNYFDSAAAPDILNRINTSTKNGGVGIAVKRPAGKDTLVIQQVVTGSPAEKSGIVTGMQVLAINDSSVVGDSAIERFSRFSLGESGAVVVVTVNGPQGIAKVSMVRQPVAFPTVFADSLAENVGYISISGFTPTTVGSQSTYTEFKSALYVTKKFPMTIVDLRDNGGGSIDIALHMCDEILTSGTVIIRQRQRRYEETSRATLTSEITSVATSGGIGETALGGGKRKYLLLGNAHSASAAEIMLVAIKEGAKAPLMGARTYGKGVGQTVRTTPGHGLALVTFLKFTSASRLDYHKFGLEPDYPDSAVSDSLLVNATKLAKTLLSQPAAKVSAAAARSNDRELSKRAAVIEWNRRQTIRRGIVELESL